MATEFNSLRVQRAEVTERQVLTEFCGPLLLVHVTVRRICQLRTTVESDPVVSQLGAQPIANCLPLQHACSITLVLRCC